MSFINKNFMLHNDVAKKLYSEFASTQPIIDYHCHLDPKMIYEDKVFENIFDVWLSGDHYKWRVIRANGVDEEYITGNKSPKEKFEKWASTLENAIGSPLYHWSALELKRYFDIDEQLSSENWEEIWEKANKYIKDTKMSPRQLIKKSNVVFLSTTDAPCDSLEYHKKIKEDKDIDFIVMPGFRPDEAFAIGSQKFDNFLIKLQNLEGEIKNYNDFIKALKNRIKYFYNNGCRVCDHGFADILFSEYKDEEINIIFNKILNKEQISLEEEKKYATKLMVDLASEYQRLNFVMQIHFGAIRNNNTKMFELLGADTGFDSIKDQSNIAYSLNGILNAISKNSGLPKTIIYNLDPSINELVATTIANFQVNSGMKGKIQFGTAWWFNDTKEGMLNQMKSLCNQGLIMNFIGMLTDSRSFLSYTRHEYFRRIFCQYIGNLVELGEIPNNDKILKKLVENVCYKNALNYFELEV